MKYNSSKLDLELKKAGIPIHGVSSDGIVSFKDDTTDQQKELASEIVKKHTPEWYVENRRKAYKPIEEQMDMQYWDKINGTNTWVEHISEVKAKYPR